MSATTSPGTAQADTAQGLDPTALRAWRAFLEAHARMMDVLTRELRDEDGLPLAWYDVLVHLSEAPERRLRMQELASAILLSKSGLTRLIDRMEDEGLVVRAVCPEDRRGTFAMLTDQGLARLEAAYPVHLAGVTEHFAAHLDPQEATLLACVLGRIADASRDG